MITGSATARVVPFGLMADGRPVEMHTLSNANGMEVCFISLGGIIGAVRVPDRNGVLADVTPGYDHLQEYVDDPHFFGSLIGRYANRIADGHFMLDGTDYALATNDGGNTLHGGPEGFHNVVWDVEPLDGDGWSGAMLRHRSPAGSGGFPGTLDLRIMYTLTDHNELVFEYAATTDAPTPVNLTQHLYLNLGGHAAGDVLDHRLTIAASRYLPIDEKLVPTRHVAPVDDTPFDFREGQSIRHAIGALCDEVRACGFDHNFVLDGARVAALLVDHASGRCVEIETTEPGLQFYSGNQITAGMHGKEGATYGPFWALALETQHFPDSPNVPDFPSTILRPGAEFRSRTVYRFGIVS